MSNVVVVVELPKCGFCRTEDHVQVDATYDGATTYGPWAYMCENHFQKYGVGLGVGAGQMLVLG